MEKHATKNVSSLGYLPIRQPMEIIKAIFLSLLCFLLIVFTSTAKSRTAEEDGYRYLRLTALGQVGTYTININELNWMVGSIVYPQTRATSASTNVTATVNPDNAWKAYDGQMGLPSVWSAGTSDFPMSITIDLGEDGAINPTGIQIGVEWNGRAMSAFTCEGSNDGENWTTLFKKSGLVERDWKRDSYNSFIFSGEEDTVAPTTPSGLSASDITKTSFNLTWDASTDNIGVASYEVFQDSESIGTTTTTSMEVTGLACDNTYSMTVKALDAVGNGSEASSPYSVEMVVCEFPNLISNAEFDEGTDGWISIFQGGAADGGNFSVVTDAEMSGTNAGKLTIENGGTADWNIELFSLFNLETDKTYEISFKAKAANDRPVLVAFQKGSSPYNNYWEQSVNLTTAVQDFGPYIWTSNTSDEVTRLNFKAGGNDADIWIDEVVVREIFLLDDTEAPSTPENLIASDITENSFTLSWDASSDNVSVLSYEVFAGFTSLGTTTSTSMNVTGMSCNTTYSMSVRAKDLIGNVSPASTAKSVATSACTGETEPRNATLGMNMSGPRPWASEFIFTNLAHYSLAWMPLETAPSFRERIPTEELTPERYLQPGSTGRLTIFWDLNRNFLATGDYVFTYEGTAEVAMSTYSTRGITEVSNTPGRIVVNIPPSDGKTFLYFDVTENSTSDPISNIRFTELDREHSTDIFRPEIVNDYTSLKAFRFMDWMKANNSTVTTWEEYPADNALLQTESISINYMLALANQTNMDAWFCPPLLADDDFLRKLAERISTELKPELRAYIELSNEVWNGGFAAQKQAAEKARELGLSSYNNNKQDAGVYYGYRTAQMENIFKEEFSKAASKPELTSVLAWQAVDTWSFENMVMPGYRMVMGSDAAPEAIAIAPYFGGNIGSAANEAEVLTWDVDMVFEQLFYNTYGDRLSGNSITVANSFNSMKAYKDITTKYGVPELLGYEGGQHLVAANNTQPLINLLADVNRDRRMFDAYMAYFDAWKEIGGDLFATFASTATYARSGSWGWKEFPAQTREQAPKYDAILTWNGNNQPDIDEPGHSIQKITLIDAKTDTELNEMEDGLVIDLQEVGTNQINMRAYTNPEITGSVKFRLTGAQSYEIFENLEPYALFGNKGTNYLNWKPAIGDYELTVTPYSESKGGGDAGTPLTISFSVIDGPTEVATVQSVTLINAMNNEELFEIEDGQIINLEEINTHEINMRAYTDPKITGSVVFNLSGAEDYSHTESVEPYAVFKNNGPNYLSWKPAMGDYVLEIIPYSESKGKGIKGTTKIVSFSIIHSAGEESMRTLQVYPNPGSNYLHISSTQEEGAIQIKIFDMYGQEIKNAQNKANFQNGRLSLDVSNLKKQYYIIHVIDNNEVQKFRWLKE